MMGECVWPWEWDGAAFVFGSVICCRMLGQGRRHCRLQRAKSWKEVQDRDKNIPVESFSVVWVKITPVWELKPFSLTYCSAAVCLQQSPGCWFWGSGVVIKFVLLRPRCCSVGQLHAFSSFVILFFSELRYFQMWSHIFFRLVCCMGQGWWRGWFSYFLFFSLPDRRNTEWFYLKKKKIFTYS